MTPKINTLLEKTPEMIATKFAVKYILSHTWKYLIQLSISVFKCSFDCSCIFVTYAEESKKIQYNIKIWLLSFLSVFGSSIDQVT